MSLTPPPITRKHVVIAGIVCAVILVVVLSVNALLSQLTGVSQSTSFSPTLGSSGSDMMAVNSALDDTAYEGRGMMRDATEEVDTIAPATAPVDSPAPLTSERKIIRNASLSILVKDIDIAADGVRAVAHTYGGDRGNENFSQYGQGMRSGTVTILVPSEHFDEALRDIKNLALRVDAETISTQDVSAQHVDLTARLKNLRATEAQYQELMTRAGSIQDILNVTQKLSETRQQIEVLQGQLDRLTGQIALSSIVVRITPESPLVTPGDAVKEWRPGTVAREAYHTLITRLTATGDDLIVFVIVGLPILLIGLLKIAFALGVIFVVYRVGRALYRAIVKTTPPVA